MKRSKLMSWTYGSRHSKVWTCSPGVNCSWLSLRVHCRQTEQPSLELLQSPIVGSASHQTQSVTNFYQPFQVFFYLILKPRFERLETFIVDSEFVFRRSEKSVSSVASVLVVGGVSLSSQKFSRLFHLIFKLNSFGPQLSSEWMTQNETRRRPKSHCWWRHRVRSFVIEKRKLF